MRRREFTTLLGGAATAMSLPFSARGQQSERLRRVADVIVGARETSEKFANAFSRRLFAFGHKEGRDITLINQFVAPQSARIEEVLGSLIPNIDLLVIWSTIGAVAAKKLGPALPTIFLAVGDPVRTGLVQSLARPGGNMTGVTYESTTETWAKRVQLLKEILPDLDRIAVLNAAGDPNSAYAMASLEPFAARLGVAFVPVDFGSAEELDTAFKEIIRSRLKAMLVIAGALTFVNGKRIAELALAHHLPACFGFRETVEVGGLMSLGPDLAAIGEQGAMIADKILKGEKLADLPVEQPIRYEVRLNLKTARALGLTLPFSLTSRADDVIE